MIVDTSAMMAILRSEPERLQFVTMIAAAERALMSAGTWVELGAVLSKPGDAAARETLEDTCAMLGISIEPVTQNQARIGHEAYLRYGKGNHAARLNFGDCFAYALAKDTGLPLLFKGDDFIHTDLVPAL